MIVLGSYPIQTLLGREAKDLDLLATLPEFQDYINGGRPSLTDSNHAFYKTDGGTIYDCELIWPDSDSLALAELILSDPETHYDVVVEAFVPSLNILYMLKMSHRYKKNSPHFLKTMRDIQKMREAGAYIQEEHMEFYKARMKATYWYNHPDLTQNKATFFNPEDSFYIYDHDSIHETVAVLDAPAYTRYARDGQEVLSDKQKFFAGPEADRLYGVYEEACVLALERSQIPRQFRLDPDWSFKMALMKVCTSITSGWFREFAWENYDEVVRIYDWMKRHDRLYTTEFGRNMAKVRPYEPERIAA